MNDSNHVAEAPGAEAPSKVPDLDTIEKWLTRDLGTCITFLNALHSDADLRKQMAVFLQGRMANSIHRPDPNQINLKL